MLTSMLESRFVLKLKVKAFKCEAHAKKKICFQGSVNYRCVLGMEWTEWNHNTVALPVTPDPLEV